MALELNFVFFFSFFFFPACTHAHAHRHAPQFRPRVLTTHSHKFRSFFSPAYRSFHALTGQLQQPSLCACALVKGEAIRFLRFNTHAPTFRRIKNKFRTHLILRGYPKKFVDPILKKITHNLRSNYLPIYPYS